MCLVHLSPTLLHQAIIRGCQSIVSVKEQLNTINIFPVADGDTGDNLASTASAIIDNSYIKPTFTEMLLSVADASLLGARGNSGIIFSQFFNSLAPQHHDKKIWDTIEFSAALSNAANSVRASITSPIDGTIHQAPLANTSSVLINSWRKFFLF
jgi:dihydroxyacetone kinase-like predicted kinase